MTGATTGHRPAVLAAALLLAVLAGPAQAVAVAGPGGTAEQGDRPVVAAPGSRPMVAAPGGRPMPAAPAAGADAPTLDLVAARLEAVDLAAGTVTLRGQRVPLHAGQLRVLGGRGELLAVRHLRAGQAVRLALEPAAPAAATAGSASTPASTTPATAPPPARRIVLIYIDG